MHTPSHPNYGSQDIEVYDTTELYGETGRFRVLQFSGKLFRAHWIWTIRAG